MASVLNANGATRLVACDTDSSLSLPHCGRVPRTLFIVGCPRSGTTMLQQALNRHSQIVIPPETKFFYDFYGRSRKRQRVHWERIQRDLQIDLVAPKQRVRTACDARRVFHTMGAAYLQRLGRNDVVYFGDKTPEQTTHLHAIREVFPNARILFLYRDGRDVALSLTKVPWIQCNIYGGMLIWLYYDRILKREMAHRSPNVLFVRYEDVVCRPKGELTRVLEFLDLDYEPSVAEGCGNREGIPEREYPWKHRALEEITTNRIGLWRRELTTQQIERLESLSGVALERLGYSRSCSSDTTRKRLSIIDQLKLAWELAGVVRTIPLAAVVSEFGTLTRKVGLRQETVVEGTSVTNSRKAARRCRNTVNGVLTVK